MKKLTPQQRYNLKKPAVAFRLDDPIIKERLEEAVKDRSTDLAKLMAIICKEWLIANGYMKVIYK